MTQTTPKSTIETQLLRPAKPKKGDEAWAFLILPKSASDILPRRGRTTVEGELNGPPFQATLEPDGQLSHWLKVCEALQKAAGVVAGDTVGVTIAPVEDEPEPEVPADLKEALSAWPEAQKTWEDTTTLARVDWIHWIESPKMPKTRQKSVANGCDMLASGKKRACCFDPSGHYSNSLSAPKAAE